MPVIISSKKDGYCRYRTIFHKKPQTFPDGYFSVQKLFELKRDPALEVELKTRKQINAGTAKKKDSDNKISKPAARSKGKSSTGRKKTIPAPPAAASPTEPKKSEGAE